MKVNPAWVDTHFRAFINAKDKAVPYSVGGTYRKAIAELAVQLDKHGIAYKIIQLGAGATKITNEVDICPKCKGLGRC